MPISLYDATIPSMLQILGSGQTWLDKAEASGMGDDELTKACLIGDMLPFPYQVKSMAIHSRGAIEAVRAGVFSPDFGDPPPTAEAMRRNLGEAENFLKALSIGEIDSFIGQDMRFEFKEKIVPFTAENFLLSFAQPNFYFHATTAYGILRSKGVKLGKLDYLGQLRAKN